MLEIRLSPKAVKDLEEIFTYTVQTWNYKQAQRYHNTLVGTFRFIASNPQIGLVYLHYKGEYRYIKSNRHLIFYKSDKEHCDIIRILHERMDLTSSL